MSSHPKGSKELTFTDTCFARMLKNRSLFHSVFRHQFWFQKCSFEGTESSTLGWSEIWRKLIMKVSDIGVSSAHRPLWCPELTWPSPPAMRDWCPLSQEGLQGGWWSTRLWHTPCARAWDTPGRPRAGLGQGLAQSVDTVSSLDCSRVLSARKERCGLGAKLCPTFCGPVDCNLPGSSAHGALQGKNTGVGCHFLLQVLFPTQGSNLHLHHCWTILYHGVTWKNQGRDTVAQTVAHQRSPWTGRATDWFSRSQTIVGLQQQ